jgi:hypothetical protein
MISWCIIRAGVAHLEQGRGVGAELVGEVLEVGPPARGGGVAGRRARGLSDAVGAAAGEGGGT